MSDNTHKNTASMGRLEREALMEIASTKISKAGAITITIAFIATLAFVFITDARNFLNLGKTKVNTEEADPIKSTFQKILAFNRGLMDWQSHTENHLFEKSVTVKQLQPLGQAAFASLREGATDVMIGKDGWLFHRPSFDLLTKKTKKVEKSQKPTPKMILNQQKQFDKTSKLLEKYYKEGKLTKLQYETAVEKLLKQSGFK
jgi:hypothetical protein